MKNVRIEQKEMKDFIFFMYVGIRRAGR